MKKKTIRLPANVYLSSHLKGAGIRFDRNIVDSICVKGLGWSFLFVALLAALLWYLYLTGSEELFPGAYFDILCFLSAFYLIYYVARLWWFSRLRRRLRADPHPIVCESYAIVIYDDRLFPGLSRTLKSAVLYKETGSLKPRFFAGPTMRGYRYEFRPEMIARVFPDRKNPKFYSVDDGTVLSTVSSRRRWFGARVAQGFGGAEKSADLRSREHERR